MKAKDKLKILLKDSKLTIATAESCSGGNIARLITSVPGASEYFLGSVVSYSALVKESVLKVSPAVIKEKGIVSSEVAAAMSEGVRELMKSSFSVSITGWADIYGDEHEPAGTAWIGVSGPLGTETQKVCSLHPTPPDSAGKEEKLAFRKTNISHFSEVALSILVKYITKYQVIENQ